MIVMNNREKNIGVLFLFIGVLVLYTGVKAQWDRKAARIQETAEATQERLKKAEELLASAIATTPKGETKEIVAPKEAPKDQVSADPDKRATLLILKELTRKGETENVTILSTDGGGNSLFKMAVEGSFTDVMKYLSYLERQDGSFSVTGASFQKASDNSKARGIKASISLKFKGGVS